MTEEAFFGSIVPTVSFPGHGLNKTLVSKLSYKGIACVVAALVAVDDGAVIQLRSVVGAHPFNHRQNKVYLQAITYLVCQYLFL